MEAGRLRLDARPGDLVALVEQTAGAFRPLAERTGITLRCKTSPLPTMAFDVREPS